MTAIVGEINAMFNQQLATLYTNLVSNKTDRERFDTAGTADLNLLAPGYVAKADKMGYRFVEREYRVMCELWEDGFRAMPQPMQDWGLSFTPEATFVMEEISHGIPLEEVAQAYLDGEVPKFMMKHIMDVEREVWEDLWARGFCHADPHLKNVLVGMDVNQNWRIWLIDFGMSLWEGHDDRALPTTVNSVEKDRRKHLQYLSLYGLDEMF